MYGKCGRTPVPLSTRAHSKHVPLQTSIQLGPKLHVYATSGLRVSFPALMLATSFVTCKMTSRFLGSRAMATLKCLSSSFVVGALLPMKAIMSARGMSAESSPAATGTGAGGGGDGDPGLRRFLPPPPVPAAEASALGEFPSSALRFVADGGGVGDAARDPDCLTRPEGVPARFCGAVPGCGEVAREPGPDVDGPAELAREGLADGPGAPGYLGALAPPGAPDPFLDRLPGMFGPVGRAMLAAAMVACLF